MEIEFNKKEIEYIFKWGIMYIGDYGTDEKEELDLLDKLRKIKDGV